MSLSLETKHTKIVSYWTKAINEFKTEDKPS